MITVNQDIYALDHNGYRDFVYNNPRANSFDAWCEAAKRAEAQIEFLKRQHDKENREAFEAGYMAGYDCPGTLSSEEQWTEARVLYRKFKKV